MPVVPIQLAGNFVAHSSSALGGLGAKGIQYFENAVFDVYVNHLSQKATVYVRPREGVETVAVAAIGTPNVLMVWTGNSNAIVIGATTAGTPTVYLNGTNIGTVTGAVKFLTETLVSGTAILS